MSPLLVPKNLLLVTTWSKWWDHFLLPFVQISRIVTSNELLRDLRFWKKEQTLWNMLEMKCHTVTNMSHNWLCRWKGQTCLEYSPAHRWHFLKPSLESFVREAILGKKFFSSWLLSKCRFLKSEHTQNKFLKGWGQLYIIRIGLVNTILR